ncbi:MAG: helicase SNF2 [Spartobacteria bacterium]|nr:helicase SNF2 [Spartobacteria bacterium]
MNGRLCDISKRLFTPVARSQGRQYFREYRVTPMEHSDTRLEAVVEGNGRHHTAIRMTPNGDRADILMLCTCPYYKKQGFCNHIWATLLLADFRGWVQPPRTVSQFSFKDEGDLKSREDWDAGDFVATDTPGRSAPPFPGIDNLRPPSDLSWQEILATQKEADLGDLSPGEEPEAPESSETELRFVIPIETLYQTARLYISILIRAARKDGSWGVWKPCAAAAFSRNLSPEDKTMLLLLGGADRAVSHQEEDVGSNFRCIEAAFARHLLPELCATNRLFARYRGQEYGPLTWDGQGPWHDELDIQHIAPDKVYTVQSVLTRDEERRPLSKPLAVLSDGWIIWPNAISTMQPSAGFGWIAAMRRQHTVRVPEAEISPFLVALMQHPSRPPLSLPADVEFRDKQVPPIPHLCVKKMTPHPVQDVPARITFRYDNREIAPWDTRTVLYQVGEHVRIPRDHEAEREAIDAFKEAGGRENRSGRHAQWNVEVKGPRLPRMIAALVRKGWIVDSENAKAFRKPGRLNISVSSRMDWFDLHVQCDFDGVSVSFPRLLEAMNRQEQWIRLEDGSFGIMPEEWLQKFGGIAALGQMKGEVVCFRQIQAGLLDVWLEAQPEASVDALFTQARDRLRRIRQIEATEPEETFIGTLRPYQKDGLGWLLFLRQTGLGGCLADDMGLGKTIQLLALLDNRYRNLPARAHRPSLVIAPSSIIFNWMREAAAFTPALRFFDYTGMQRPKDISVFDEHDVVVTTYGTLRRDIAKLKEYEFDFIVLDEAQAIKNAGAQTAKACRLLRGAHRVALSGTPIENHLSELWSLFEFLNPGLLGRATEFNKRWAKNPDPQARSLLAKALQPFILRRTKAQVAPDLPDRQEETLFCELPPRQRALYRELQQYYRQTLLSSIHDHGLNKSKIQVLEALLRLRQAACHPALVNPEDTAQPSAKFELLIPRLMEVIEEGHKALVFSQFTSFLALLRAQLDSEGVVYEYLDGRTRKRQERVDRFQADPDCPLFLISLKAGGLGLNLTAAEYVFLLDPWWNPAVEAQAIDRAHRIGQTNKVFAYRLIARDTVEEKILALQESKRNLADAIINRDNALLRTLSVDDLKYLIG